MRTRAWQPITAVCSEIQGCEPDRTSGGPNVCELFAALNESRQYNGFSIVNSLNFLETAAV